MFQTNPSEKSISGNKSISFCHVVTTQTRSVYVNTYWGLIWRSKIEIAHTWHYRTVYLINRFSFKGCTKSPNTVNFPSIRIILQGSLFVDFIQIPNNLGTCEWKGTEYSIDGKTWRQTKGNPGRISVLSIVVKASPTIDCIYLPSWLFNAHFQIYWTPWEQKNKRWNKAWLIENNAHNRKILRSRVNKRLRLLSLVYTQENFPWTDYSSLFFQLSCATNGFKTKEIFLS